MERESETTKATVTDARSGSETSGREVDVPYSFDYDVLTTDEEVRERFSPADLRKMANAKLKQQANSAARQKAIAPYLPDTSTPEFKREQLIKNLVNTFGVPRDIAEQQIDAMISAQR